VIFPPTIIGSYAGDTRPVEIAQQASLRRRPSKSA